MIDIDKLVRPHIKKLVPYSSARDEYSGQEGIFLDANENSLGSVSGKAYNRYPDPYQQNVKHLLSEIKRISEKKIFLGNGSDEIIDLLIRLFCRPGKDKIIVTPPTYGMYEVSARINEIKVISIPLIKYYQLNVEAILSTKREKPKMLFLCTPNNPSGNNLKRSSVLKIINDFEGIIVIDEAYADFSKELSYLTQINRKPNLIVIQTFSKAWGMAGLRLGAAYAHEKVVAYLNKIKPPYNINEATQQMAIKALKNNSRKELFVGKIISEREWLEDKLKKLDFVEDVYPSDANFFLVRFTDSDKVYKYLLDHLIIVRDRSRVLQCGNSLRITIGTNHENRLLVEILKKFNTGRK